MCIRDRCHNFEIVFREPTLIADALALGHPRLDVDQFPDGILLGLYLGLSLIHISTDYLVLQWIYRGMST